MGRSIKERQADSPLYGSNAAITEYFYERFLDDPASVSPEWADYFRDIGNGAGGERPHAPIRAALVARSRTRHPTTVATPDGADLEKQAAVLRLINNYRLHGYMLAQLDPLGLTPDRHAPDLDATFHGLTDADLEREFVTADLADSDRLTLREILAKLKDIYCGSIGAEFSHISNTAERLWLRERFEVGRVHGRLTPEEKTMILQRLTAAEGIERYLHTRYVGQKRFSLEGGESLIPLLDDMIQEAGRMDVREIVIGMAHRGRLNVLVNVLGKAPAELFSEFEGGYDTAALKGSGDVKYHMGFSADLNTEGDPVHVVLAFNPSHLEIVNPVVVGSVRARQDRRNDHTRDKIVPFLIHGDAAFAGQGVVMETLQLSATRAFATGGTVHVICNNQVGFTTSNPRDSRSTPFCSDVAKMIEAPVFHVNGDDPEAVVFVARLALDYRMRFNKDVVIDLVCYRRHGHNEADEPAMTQPRMYQTIRKHPTVRQTFAGQLSREGIVDDAAAAAMVETYRDRLDHGQPVSDVLLGQSGDEYTIDWSEYLEGDLITPVATRVDRQHLERLGARMLELPDGFEVHKRVQKILDDRAKMIAGEKPLDWGCAENLAYATLLDQGFGVRLVGQDSGRGTFSHRHAVLHDQADVAAHTPLAHLSDDQPMFLVADSLLSEEAVMGFEYGYATTEPRVLTIWEGQFGDFANGAQVVIDQFISSGEAKWGRLCGLTLFLPHGYEGQGPEHSSARLERFLQLCAENNMQVCVPSTPAQMFHMLRRQMLRQIRRPLIVMTPKSLLRHRDSVSTLEALEKGQFQLVIPDRERTDPDPVTRVVFCSGKVYYDLIAMRRAHEDELSEVAVVRLEQLYPFPAAEYAAELDRYARARTIVWCQEEPQNQGAWYQIRHRLQESMGTSQALFYAGRPGSAAPACGYYKLHGLQQENLVKAALGLTDDDGSRD